MILFVHIGNHQIFQIEILQFLMVYDLLVMDVNQINVNNKTMEMYFLASLIKMKFFL